MVVALYGDWGSGKTSTLNLCLRALKDIDAVRPPLTLHFNPWWYSNTGELLFRFFDLLGNTLERERSLEGIREDLYSYRDFAVPVAAVTDLFVGGGYVTAGAEILKLAADRTAKRRPGASDVYTLKDRIGRRISDADRRIVVVIDDIDRLSAIEIRDIFKLVKVVADFPNTHYLLAFDFETTTMALSEVQGTDGARYLEKIVQTIFRLPDPAPHLLMAFVMEEVEGIASDEGRITEDEWAQTKQTLEVLSFYGLDHLWVNMRRVNRFLDNFRLTLSSVAGEVRLSDFFMLEALRVCEPVVYERIMEGQGLLLGATPGAEQRFVFGDGQRSRNTQEEARETTKNMAEGICAAASRVDLRPVIMELLEKLFPRVQAAVGSAPAYGSSFLDEWVGEKRVCVPELFHVATAWGLPSGMISALEVEELLQITDPDRLRERLLAYDNDTRPGVDARTVLERTGAFYRIKAAAPALHTILTTVFSMTELGPTYAARFRLGVDLLKRLKEVEGPAAPKSLILSCIQRFGLTPLLAEVMRSLGREHGWQERQPLPVEFRTLLPVDFEQVKTAVAEDIARQAQDDQLLSRDVFDQYLYLWREVVGDTAPADYLKKLVYSERGLVRLLDAYTVRSDPAFYYDEERWWRPSKEGGRGLKVGLLDTFELGSISKEKAGELLSNPPKWLSEKERKLLGAFFQSYAVADTE